VDQQLHALPAEGFPVNISVNGNSPGVGYSGVENSASTPAVTATGSASGLFAPGVNAEDRLSVSQATLRITTTLSTLSASQMARVSRLQSLYASGRYDPSPSKTAQSIVSGALTNSDKL
jgi:hypothetical protein